MPRGVAANDPYNSTFGPHGFIITASGHVGRTSMTTHSFRLCLREARAYSVLCTLACAPGYVAAISRIAKWCHVGHAAIVECSTVKYKYPQHVQLHVLLKLVVGHWLQSLGGMESCCRPSQQLWLRRLKTPEASGIESRIYPGPAIPIWGGDQHQTKSKANPATTKHKPGSCHRISQNTISTFKIGPNPPTIDRNHTQTTNTR